MPKDLSMYGDVNTYPCSLVMSGVESDAYFDIAIGEGIDRMLMSYHYIQRKGKNFLKTRLSKHPHVKMMIDSGAHTFHAKEEEFANKPLEFWENYLERYTGFIKDNKEFIFSCVELDIANLVGFDKVDYFRQKYFEPLKDEGILVCYVWHDYDGDKHWEEMCAKYDYVGFSLVNSNMGEKDIIRKMNIARRHGTLVHGFAVTRTEIMTKVPFFTGDSTTWLVGTQYGELNYFDGRKMRRLKKDKWKYEYKQRYINIGANWDLAGEENPYELIRINLIVFKQAEEYIRKRIRPKTYWLQIPQKKSTSLRNARSKKVEEVTEVEKPKKVKRIIKKVKKKKKDAAVETQEAVETPITKEEVKEVAEAVEAVSSRPSTKFEDFQAMSSTKSRELDEQVSILPSLDWYEGEMEDYSSIVKALGIETNGNDKDTVLDFLFNCTLFLKQPEELDTFDENVIFELCEGFTKQKEQDYDRAVLAVTKFLEDNITLRAKTALPNSNMMTMEAQEKAKEREEYLEDDEYELVDVSEAELANLLPAPREDGEMPEVEELDAELKRSGIVAVRDEKGRFLKGQKRVRKPKNIYSEKFPKLACNTCYKAGDCPEFKPDHVCAYDKIFNKFDTRNAHDVMDAMHSMVNLNLGRMQRQAMFEIMDGGMADGTVTSLIDQNVNLLAKLQQLQEIQKQVIATQHRTVYGDGTLQETTTVTNPGGGILSQIFGGVSSSNSNKEEEESRDIIDAEVVE